MAKTANGSGEVETTGTAGQVATQQAFRQLLQKMALTASMDREDGNSVSSQVNSVEAILNAETEEEMWEADERGPLGGRNLPDVEQEIFDFTVKYSRDAEMQTIFVTEDGKRMYLMVSARRLDTGEEIVWNTSAPLIVAKIFWLDQRNKFPYPCVIRATDLGGGKAVLKLKPVVARQPVL